MGGISRHHTTCTHHSKLPRVPLIITLLRSIKNKRIVPKPFLKMSCFTSNINTIKNRNNFHRLTTGLDYPK